MPSQAANAAALRADGHQMEVYLSAMVGAAVLVGAVSATPTAESALNIAYTTSSGSSANVKRGMRVVIETSGGDYKGTLSVRFAGTISSTNLPVREFSEGHVQVESGDVLRVYNDFVLTDRLVSATEAFEPDYETYTDQNGTVKPIATSGGWWTGFVDSGQTYATITLYGAESYTVDEDSGGSVTHLWTLPSGVAFAPGSADTDVSPTVRADAGYYIIQHTVTDATNSKTEVQQVALRVHSTSDAPYELTLDSPIAGEPARGFGFSMALYANADLATLPDLSPVILWTRERINGSVQSFGHKVTGRSHILCVGYLRRDRTSVDGAGLNDAVRFEVVSPLARLFELPGFSKVMDREASPDAWNEIEALTVRRGILQLARYYTNYPQLFDMVFDGFDDANYPALYLQKKTPGEQVTELADSRGGRIATDQTGRLEIQQRLDLTALASRSGVTTTFTLTLDDCIDVEVERDHVRPVETHHTRGFSAGVAVTDSQPMFAKWAASPGTGADSPTSERLIVDDVADLYEQAAMRGAATDRVFFDANGVQQHAPKVTVTLPGSYWGLFRFYREYVLLDMDETARGIDLSTFRFMVESAELEIAGGTGRVRVMLQAATYAIGAVDDTPEAESYPPFEPPVLNPPTVITPPVNGGVGLGINTGTLAVFDSTNSKVHISTNFDRLAAGGTPTFTGYTLSLTGTLACAAVRADSYVPGAASIDAYVNTTSQARKLTDVFSARTLGTGYSYADGAADFTRQAQIQTERGNPAWVLAAVYKDGVGTRVYRSTDGSASWSDESSLPTAYDNNLPGNTGSWSPGLWMNPAGNGEAIVSAGTATGSPPGADLWQTTDYGATWTKITTTGWTDPGEYPCGCIVKPFSRSDVVFHGYPYVSGGAVATALKRIINTAQVDISPEYGGNDYGAGYMPGSSTNAQQNRAISVADDDPNAVVVCAWSATAAKFGVFQTFNGLDSAPTWTTIVIPDATLKYSGAYYVRRDLIYLVGDGGALALCKWVNGSWFVYEMTISGCGAICGILGG